MPSCSNPCRSRRRTASSSGGRPAEPTRRASSSFPIPSSWRGRHSRRASTSLAALPTTVYGYSYVLTGRGDPVTVESARVTGAFFDALAVRPLLGRTFRAADDREGARPTVVVTHAFWTNVLGADPGVVGSGLTLTGVDFTVIGVLPAGFVFPRGVDVFTALGTRPGLANNRTVFLQVVGRLRPGVSREQAASELDGIVSRLELQRPGAIAGDQVAALTPLRDHVLGSGRLVASLLFAGAVVLLLVAGINLGGLLATRAAGRGGEVALRLGLGASTRHLVRQFVAEGLVLATLGTIAGIGLAVAMLDAVVALAPDGIARMASASIDGGSLLFAAACLVVLTLGMGCCPAVAGPRPVHRHAPAPERRRRGRLDPRRARRRRAGRRRGDGNGGAARHRLRPRRELRQPARRERGLRPRRRPDGVREPESRALPRCGGAAPVLPGRDGATRGEPRGGSGRARPC